MNDSTADWSGLVQEARIGSHRAFEAIYARTRNDVYRTLVLLTTSRSDADEIMQDVYIELWRCLRDYDCSRPFVPWLHGIAVRQVRNYRRKTWRRWRTFHKTADVARAKLLEEGAGCGSQLGQRSELIESVEALPLRHREVIVLRYFQGYALTEVADILGIPVGTARSRNHAALRKLRADYEESEKEEHRWALNEN